MPPITLMAVPYMAPGPMNVIMNLIPCFPAPFLSPIPDPGIAMTQLMVGEEPDVLMDGTPPGTMVCLIMITTVPAGPGPLFGVASGLLVGPAKPMMGAPNVLVNGIPILVCGLSVGLGNGTNCLVLCAFCAVKVMIG